MTSVRSRDADNGARYSIGDRHYLLDASCFYDIGGNAYRQKALREAGVSVTTSILAPMEISNVEDSERDYGRRKAAMRALTGICPSIIGESPDDVVARAFGMSKLSTTPFDAKDIARTFELAGSREEALSGVLDPAVGKLRRLNPSACDEWKREIADRYCSAIRLGNVDIKDCLADDRSMRDILGVAEMPTGLDKKLDVLFDHPLARYLSLLGIAIRAGLLSECEAKNKDDFVAAAAEFVPLIYERYNGKLESYISMELAYRRWLAPGHEPERNAVFDLEYFLHLDAHEVSYIFVTTEKKWLDLGRSALPGRVRALADVLQQPGPARAGN